MINLYTNFSTCTDKYEYSIEETKNKEKFRIFLKEYNDRSGDQRKVVRQSLISEKESLKQAQKLASQLVEAFNLGFYYGNY